MPWTLDKSHADFSAWDSLTNTEQENWDTFQNAVANTGAHPATAAQQVRNSDYKNLTGNQFQIRLSQKNRATFLVLPAGGGGTVQVLQVGGHT